MEFLNNDITNLIKHLRSEGDVILLDSQLASHPANNKTLLAARPKKSIKSYGNKILIEEQETVKEFEGNPWVFLEEFYDEQRDWMFGYLGYDLKNHIEEVTSSNRELIVHPDLYFFVPGLLLEIDAVGTVKILKGELESSVSLNEELNEIHLSEKELTLKEDYVETIKAAKKKIKEGDFYEINLSYPLKFEFEGDSWSLFSKMKEVGPVPFASYLTCGTLHVCSSSPERFIKKTGKRIVSQPIKGTISRSEKNDEQAKSILKNSEKERAENLMIVDLVRNDLSRIAREGSVHVSDLFEIQTFETVHQMVSTVEAESNEGVSIVEILKACFPMGSMTGAPKISVMKAIDELEDYKRGIYSGAIGYITPEEDFDFNVVIRTAIIKENELFYPVGGAITADSDPDKEWEETRVKAKAITNVIK